MSETTNSIRLMKAAKEFNIGRSTVVEFLTQAGFSIDNKPDPVLSGEMYHALMNEFAADKAAKKKSENVVLNKALEEKKAKEEPAKVVSLKQQEAVKIVPIGKVDLEPKPKKKAEEEVPVAAAPVEVPVEPTPEVEEKPKKKKSSRYS